MSGVPSESFINWLEKEREAARLKAAADKAKEEADAAEKNLYAAMDAAGLAPPRGGGGVTLDLGEEWGDVTFTRGYTEYTHVYSEAALREWIKREGREQEMLGDTLRKKVLNDYAKRAKKIKGMPFPDGVEPRTTHWVKYKLHDKDKTATLEVDDPTPEEESL